jgi:hypothetical protein
LTQPAPPPEAVPPSPAPKRRLREWLGRFALIFGFPLAALALVEYGLWAFDVAPPEPPPPPSRLGVHDAGALHKYLSGPNTDRLICLGESTVAGAPFEHKMNMCTVMATALGVDLVNLAGSAQDSNDILHHAEIACQHPMRFLYVYFGHNEFLHLERYAHGTPPAALSAMSAFLHQFRFYRLIQRAVAPPVERAADLGQAALTDEQVYAIYDDNLRKVLDVCKNTRVVLSTVTSNPDLAFPEGGRTLRETWRRNRRFPTVPESESCRQCFRAGPQINAAIRRAAADYAGNNLVLVDTEDLGTVGKGFERFWDHVHPKPAVHLEIAERTLDAVKAAGWIETYGPVEDTRLSDRDLATGAEERAMYLLQYDPPAALRSLDALPRIDDRLGAGLTRALAGFVMDDQALLQRGLAEAKEALAAPHVRGSVTRCIESGGAYPFCLHWHHGVLMNAAEQAEFVDAVSPLGDALLTKVAGAL